jgi:hypothetical protein
MRRALVLVSVLAAWLLLAAPALAPAAPRAPRPQPEDQEDVIFGLEAEGFTVSVFVEDNDGDQTASLSISRDELVSSYVVPAKLTENSVKARFGSLGSLDFRFKPKKATSKCGGGLIFTGTFRFTGENGYIHVDADRAEGAGLEQVYSPCPGTFGPAPKLNVVSTGVYLEAIAGSWKHGTARKVEAAEYTTRGGHRSVNVSGFVREEREGMIVGRGATVTAGASAFRHNLKAGTATLSPPAPFVGSATLTPGRGGKGIWQGSLQIPVLGGGEPIDLTGPAFSARVYEEEPFDG